MVLLHVVRRMGARTSRSLIKKVEWAAQSTGSCIRYKFTNGPLICLSCVGVERWASAGCSIQTMCIYSFRAGPAVASSIPPMRPVRSSSVMSSATVTMIVEPCTVQAASTRLRVTDTSVASTHVLSSPMVFFQWSCSARSNLDNSAAIEVERPSGVVDWKGRRALETTFQISARGWNVGIHVPPGVVFSTNPLPAFTVSASRLPIAGFIRKSR
ncbi:hypothetical protein B0H16DRAFT_1543955 [Mycena metata]|uniref:Uncharacterized protein n=1 Tax=Mycena metata TaxID=1033252 RepID=A0AAD7J1G3_9AGAR|nr:hypothetical protein B0H16DRAFT_1543955 [Mycena metata]